jgi:ParB-like chromosome segregation protein Spo0J
VPTKGVVCVTVAERSHSSANPFPSLSSDEYADLRASIEQHGVLVPPLCDQYGELIDGFHRVQICAELGLPRPPMHTITVRDDEHRRQLAVTLNVDRRHLTPEARRALVASLREGGLSTRKIAEQVGASQSQVLRDLKAQVNRGGSPAAIVDGNGDRARSRDSGASTPLDPQPPASDTVTGRDGKTYPATARPQKRKRPKVVRPEGSPSWASALTGQLGKLRRDVSAAREWRDSGHKPPAETYERLDTTRREAASLVLDLDELLGHSTRWGEPPRAGEHVAAAYMRRAAEILAHASDMPDAQFRDCRDRLDAILAQLDRVAAGVE